MKRSLSPWSQQHKLMLWLSVTVVATGMRCRSGPDQRHRQCAEPDPRPRPIRTVSSQRRRAAGSTISIAARGKRPFIMLHGINRSRAHLDHIAPFFIAISTSSRWICAGSATRIGLPRANIWSRTSFAIYTSSSSN